MLLRQAAPPKHNLFENRCLTHWNAKAVGSDFSILMFFASRSDYALSGRFLRHTRG